MRTELLQRLISIGIKNSSLPEQKSESPKFSEPAEYCGESENNSPAVNYFHTPNLPEFPEMSPDSGFQTAENMLLPIVRNAGYFLQSHQGEDSLVYVPLTDFIAVGITHGQAEKISPVYYSQIESEHREVDEILTDSLHTLREVTNSRSRALKLSETKIAGAKVISFTDLENYESSWFADFDIITQLTERIAKDYRPSLPLFVPAARTKLYIIFDDDPHLVDFFKTLRTARDSDETIYPLPHTVTADGWREWIPLPGSPLAEVLGELRGHFRKQIYDTQVKQMLTWGEFGALKTYQPQILRSGEHVSNTFWTDTDRSGSIPDTDFITFVREPSPHPWEENRGMKISIRSYLAREIWKNSFQRNENAWPPRWDIVGFPDAGTLELLKAASAREF
ncbi:hypothetical protein RQN30_07960 [Arcanobacterium hippocoleae]